MTGKAIIPFIKLKDGFHFDFMENKQILQSEEEVSQAEKMIADKGYYPVRFTPEEIDYYREHPEEREALFTQKALKRLEDWLAFAESKLKDTGIKVFVCPGNDDMFEIDGLLNQSPYIISAEGQAFDLDENCQLISTGWCNPTPWNTFREESDSKLLERLEKMLPLVRDFRRLICNFHGPPYKSGLDDAPELDENLRPKFAGQSLVPVGSKAVRDFIKKKKSLMRLLVITGLGIMTASLIFLPLAASVILYFVAISVVGVGTGMVLPCLNTLVTSSASIKERGLITSFYGSVRFFGVALGPPLYGILMARGTELMFWSSAGLSLLGAVLAVIFLKAGKSEQQGAMFVFVPSPARKPHK
jgi:Icc-related predicted phosphoesterase